MSNLLNATECAKATGFSRSFVEAVKAHAKDTEDDPFFGGRFTRKHIFESWVISHPDFRAYHVWTRKASVRHQQRQMPVAFGISCEQ